MPVFSRELGIDLGTMNTVIAEGNQILLEEPTVVAIVMEEQKIVEWGRAAKDMVGRVPESIEVVQPLQHGVIAEYEVTERMLQYLIKRLTGSMLFFRPRVMITVPYGVTSVESRAVHEAGLGSGSREVYLIRQPLAAALGVDLPIGTPSGNMIICLGGGTNQVAVLAMNDTIIAETARTGGLALDEAIISYIRKKFGLLIGQPTAEQIKVQIGAAISLENPLSLEIQGQDRVTGLPRPVTLATDDIVEALEEPLAELVQLVKRVLEKTPPELISDIIDRGVALCGGGALLRGVEKYLTKSLGIPAYLVDHPTTCTAQGAARALGMREALRRSLIRV
ncbi:MAG TPA: rod shape-determining protein [Anaerolineaceae bacterium]|jgi:rod shape-determining protein MreB|nr:rod shape-determining protein [Anaerolineaceae bacterium]HOH20745.1 rod shape-determining protein [Anaerolineaceae bacterium]HOU43074.1 rod shape-determining protein [Anaerolineaceae bacterium]HQF46662.1 rod shape-determining protein [Anaerolineaceae bacterium]HQH34580.1 rod shape-determining protein [Anaerolineaceae bacterium]